ncbi:hypothetical protein HPP_0800 [Hydrangea phyllody phytoplasma]|uniref:DUF721 domain-containing protein n=2 Tax=16SrI (Aster yellows group) TaxID=3042590 RepID=A0ABQ5PSK0_9MOLU|nr:hypothetical protein HPP_0800 [Hydrangea phyllody phytoplasma]GLH61289.1 hypothetical protein RHYP_2350 [Rhus yellows phytoplasma]GLH61682.1 hypothetical protein HP2P_0890 [Hydrangea phyllody phytoplasma]
MKPWLSFGVVSNFTFKLINENHKIKIIQNERQKIIQKVAKIKIFNKIGLNIIKLKIL